MICCTAYKTSTLYRNKNQQTKATCNNIDEFYKHNVKEASHKNTDSMIPFACSKTDKT